MLVEEVNKIIHDIVYGCEHKKVTVFYHDNCTDGFMSALAAFFSLNSKIQHDAVFVPIQYGQVNLNNSAVLDVYKNSDVTFILDFSFSKELLEVLDQVFKGPIVLIDHHETVFNAFNLTPDFKGIIKPFSKTYLCLDNEKSGAMLTWDYFYVQQGKDKWFNGIPHTPISIVYTDDGDRWVFNYGDNTHHFRAGISAQMTKWKIDSHWTKIFYCGEKIFKDIMNNGKAIHETLMNDVEIILRDKDIIKLQDFDIPAVNCSEKFRSEVGNRLAKESLSGIGATWHYSGKTKKVKVSLRSVGDQNVNLLANNYGGGGHRNAAGFEIDLDTWMTHFP